MTSLWVWRIVCVCCGDWLVNSPTLIKQHRSICSSSGSSSSSSSSCCCCCYNSSSSSCCSTSSSGGSCSISSTSSSYNSSSHCSTSSSSSSSYNSSSSYSSSILVAIFVLHNANNSTSVTAHKFGSPVKRWQLCQLLFFAPNPLGLISKCSIRNYITLEKIH